MTEQLVATNGVELCVDRRGDGARSVLLLGGADASLLRWPRRFVEDLLGAGLRVVRIEHRDSGRSTKIPAEEPYLLDDMARDVVGVLDALAVDGPVDVVGYSLGGAIAQVLALDHPTRVRTLSLVATTPGAGDERLASPEDWFVDKMVERHLAPPPRTEHDRVEWTVDLYRTLAGDRYRFDEAAQRTLAVEEVRRAWYPESGHGVAATASPSRLDRLAEAVSCPTLVVHGTKDPVYPVEHAEALARAIPGARLEIVDGLGHEVPEAFGPELARFVLSFATGGDTRFGGRR